MNLGLEGVTKLEITMPCMKTAIIKLLSVVFLFGVSVGLCSEAPKPGQVVTVTLLGGKQITGKITKLDLGKR